MICCYKYNRSTTKGDEGIMRLKRWLAVTRTLAIKGITYTILAALLLGALGGIVLLFRSSHKGISSNVASIIAVMVIILAFQPVKSVFERFADNLIAKGRYVSK